MKNLDALYEQLVAADAKGDIQSAKQLQTEMKTLLSEDSPVAPTPPQQNVTNVDSLYEQLVEADAKGDIETAKQLQTQMRSLLSKEPENNNQPFSVNIKHKKDATMQTILHTKHFKFALIMRANQVEADRIQERWQDFTSKVRNEFIYHTATQNPQHIKIVRDGDKMYFTQSTTLEIDESDVKNLTKMFDTISADCPNSILSAIAKFRIAGVAAKI